MEVSQAQDRLLGVGLLCSHDLGDRVGVVVVPQSVSVTSAESDTVTIREDKPFFVGNTHVFVTSA